MFRALYDYFDRLGITLDVLINVILGGKLDQTVSLRCALAARDNKPLGCFFCKLLNYLVEKDHCEKQFDDSPIGPLAAVRAAFAFVVSIYAFYYVICIVFNFIVKGLTYGVHSIF